MKVQYTERSVIYIQGGLFTTSIPFEELSNTIVEKLDNTTNAGQRLRFETVMARQDPENPMQAIRALAEAEVSVGDIVAISRATDATIEVEAGDAFGGPQTPVL